MSLDKIKTFVVVHDDGYWESATATSTAYRVGGNDESLVDACSFGVTDGTLYFWGPAIVDGPIAAFARGSWDRVGLHKK